jgi:aminoglycoside phosphotransferase family enzyme
VNTADAELRAKVDCLSRPETYPDRPLAVEVIETHFAWVFLAGRFVYKLKKPLHFRDFDLTSLATRRANCELEVVLNRRLAPAVYIGTVPLCADGASLVLRSGGVPVEWLVKMHRLPRDRSLDRLAAADALPDDHLHALMKTLAHFYATAARAPWDGRAYRRALAEEIDGTAEDLAAPALGLDAAEVREIAANLKRHLTAHADTFHARIANGRVVDAHGDLRPEHVFLTLEPQIIDCLEFSAALRLRDSAAEIGFLALECERLGHAKLARRLVELYRSCGHDDVGTELLGFYRASQAFIRAKLAAWHLHDELAPATAEHWRERARWYLAVAASAAHVTASAHGRGGA